MKKLWHMRKVYLTYILWRFGLRTILPAVIVNRKKIIESGASLVDISGDKRFSFDRRCDRRGGCWVRVDLVPMLATAASSLPDGHKLHLFGGWRSIGCQWTAWLHNVANKRAENPDASDGEVARIARLTSADPSGPLCPHQTGGAVDLTVVDKYGRELDMGTPFSYHGPECRMDYTDLKTSAHYNRILLHNAMTAAGFRNYPGEWWHYSYGDRAWAAYGRHPNAVYGRAYCRDYKITDEEKKTLAKHGIKLKNGE